MINDKVILKFIFFNNISCLSLLNQLLRHVIIEKTRKECQILARIINSIFILKTGIYFFHFPLSLS
jgi:hypothetical protein